ncbi:hypothetical protein [Pseudomonas sp. BN102]|uniref:hypothetical protein n=1 Tax=Pseudomonas sp. BN102 TaxID=2567886 RepID=UPI0024582D77|nr:hypothetical protein [Pseudomonas sp. BN102]MDH4610373.1 hypothetical protein [Pseudomonas sp. BN102]
MKINERMAEVMADIGFEEMSIPTALVEILKEGFIIKGECVVLAALAKMCGSVSLADFPDKTGYESFVNSIHIDDYVESEFLHRAISFSRALIDIWKVSGIDGDIRVIICGDELGAVIKFHFVREGEDWVSSDLELYEDAVMVVDSN